MEERFFSTVGKIKFVSLNGVLILIISIWFSSTVFEVTSLGIRPSAFPGNVSTSQNSSCSGQTTKATYGCPCLLTGQKCFNYGTTCNSYNGSMYNSSSIKLGRCSCGSAFVATASKICRGTFRLNATAGLIAPFNVSGCLGAYTAVPGLNLTVSVSFFYNFFYRRTKMIFPV